LISINKYYTYSFGTHKRSTRFGKANKLIAIGVWEK